MKTLLKNSYYNKIDRMGLKHVVDREELFKRWIDRRFIPFSYAYDWIGELILKGKLGMRLKPIFTHDVPFIKDILEMRRVLVQRIINESLKDI